MKLVLLRHGESEWNKLNLFTGWTDADLSDKGRGEAKQVGIILRKEGYAHRETGDHHGVRKFSPGTRQKL